jgi:flagellar basal body-associated protein FliL
MKILSIIYMVAIVVIVVSGIAGAAIYMIDKNTEQNDQTN